MILPKIWKSSSRNSPDASCRSRNATRSSCGKVACCRLRRSNRTSFPGESAEIPSLLPSGVSRFSNSLLKQRTFFRRSGTADDTTPSRMRRKGGSHPPCHFPAPDEMNHFPPAALSQPVPDPHAGRYAGTKTGFIHLSFPGYDAPSRNPAVQRNPLALDRRKTTRNHHTHVS